MGGQWISWPEPLAPAGIPERAAPATLPWDKRKWLSWPEPLAPAGIPERAAPATLPSPSGLG